MTLNGVRSGDIVRLPHEEAIALVRVLVGDDTPTAGKRSWLCPIAGGQRTVALAPAPSGATPAARG
jgi:hypothetical protein